MIKLQGKLPRRVYVACSGGVDSMVAVDFLKRNHDVFVLYFNHGTTYGHEASAFVEQWCAKNNIGFLTNVTTNTRAKNSRESQEEYWRDVRYDWLERCTERQIVTAHHLDDCVETWVWSSMHGTGKIIPYSRNKRVLRPFRLNRKRDLELWANLNNVPYIEDESNAELAYTRNYVRHVMMPNVLKVNPGIHKTIAKKVYNDLALRINTIQ
jgi:tRNA(Ile)-lysidine synthase|tara:strand:+ start:1454 stop:2083 length:630 start_codon:yes stop_codon:yes gene_type:complete